MNTESSGIYLAQPYETKDVDQEWMDLTDPVARRKRQNRLHQRLWRQRQKAKNASDTPKLGTLDSWAGHGLLVPASREQSCDWGFKTRITGSEKDLHLLNPEASRPTAALTPVKIPKGKTPTPLLIPPLIPYLTPATLNTPLPPIIFPLSPDYHLITLIQYNVQRAMMYNMIILSLLDDFPTECHGAFSIPLLPFSPPTTLPPCLLPTAIQLSTPHDHRFGIIPWPAMRDNLILNAGKIDEDDLCCDLVGGLYEGFNEVEQRGIMVWGEPWREDGWEVSEGFVKKWGFMLRGCGELVEATNRWRARRGEAALVVEV